jgi:hypothetical protein
MVGSIVWKEPGSTKEARVYVQAAFGDEPLSTAYSWTEVTKDVRSINIRRGRSHELDEFAAGRATIVVDNNDGDWTFGTTGGTYGSSDVKPGLPVRVQGSWPSTNSTDRRNMFWGFVENVQLQFSEGGRDKTAVIEAVDALKYLELSVVYEGTTFASKGEALLIHDVLENVGWGFPTAGSTWPGKNLSKSTLQATTAHDTPALSLIRLFAESANGEFFVNRDGQPRYLPRTFYDGIAASTRQSGSTYSDTGGGIEIHAVDWHYDDINVFNDWIVESNGSSGRSVSLSTVSADAYGVRSISRAGLLITSTSERDSAADWLLGRWKDAHVRLNRITLKPSGSTSLFFNILKEGWIGQIISVNHSAIGLSTSASIEGIQHRIRPGGDWETTWLLSPSVEVATYP